MKKNILQLTLGLSILALSQSAKAQCPAISCGADLTVNTDSAMCDAVVNYALPTAADPCAPFGSQTFTYTGTEQTFVVPAGVTSISVEAFGAQGGSNSPSTNINYGGRVQADLPVTPGTTIFIYVGEQPNGLAGGWNGGGNGETAGQGGGGASDIRIGGNTFSDRVLVAGAGGGGGFWMSQEVHGGLGGGLVGGNGYRVDFTTAPGGEGGTQATSGNGTCGSLNNPIVSGGFGFGGAPNSCGCEGYGGGGGWYGGAGSGNCRGGGGGSSYTDPSATNVIHNQGVRAGNGEITFTWGVAPAITQIAGLSSGSVFPIGTTTNTFVADNNGVADTCSFDVIVLDNQAPSVVCPQNFEICEGETISNSTPSTADNCTGETVTYVCTGATASSGVNSVDGITFNPGTTTVWYIVTDVAGNQDSCSFDVVVHPSPTISIAAFNPDSLCNYSDPIALPAATPAFGSYSGTGISGSMFDPSISGDGTFYITYTYTDSLGCTNSDSTAIFVDGCSSLQESQALSNTTVYPNPSSGVFTVSFGTITEPLEYVVTAVDGRIVQSGIAKTTADLTVDLGKEKAGIYMLHLKGSQANKTLTLIKD